MSGLSGMQMLLRSFGVDPDAIMGQVNQIAGNVERVATALEILQKQNTAILSVLRSTIVHNSALEMETRAEIIAVIDAAQPKEGDEK